jgi:hypothetical protein
LHKTRLLRPTFGESSPTENAAPSPLGRDASAKACEQKSKPEKRFGQLLAEKSSKDETAVTSSNPGLVPTLGGATMLVPGFRQKINSMKEAICVD